MDYSSVISIHIQAKEIPPGRQYPMTITAAEVQLFAKFGAGPTAPKDQAKLVLKFRETDKSMVCNRTNAHELATKYGSDTENLIGKRVVLSQCQTNMGPAIRLTVPAPFAPAPVAAPPPVDPHSGDLDDIPF